MYILSHYVLASAYIRVSLHQGLLYENFTEQEFIYIELIITLMEVMLPYCFASNDQQFSPHIS